MTRQTKNEYYYSLIEELIESITTEHHAVCEHGEKSDKDLMTRCSTERVDASCFSFTGEKVVDMITDIIYDEPSLLGWIKSSVAEAFLITAEYEGCGRKFLRKGSHDWNNGAMVCDKVRVILGKKLDMTGALTGLYLITAYPF